MQNLTRRPSGIYAFRLAVPGALRPFVGKREIIISTGTTELALAKIAAGAALGADPAQLAQRLADLGAQFYVVAKNWSGWAVGNVHEDLEHEQDDLDQVRVVISSQRLGGPAAQLRYSGRLRIRYREEALEAAQVPATGICQF